jgi:hypothetical protein
MTNDVFDLLGTEEAQRLMSEAIKRAAEKSRRLGLAVPVNIAGEWLAMHPDGRLETIVRPGAKPEFRGTIDKPLQR